MAGRAQAVWSSLRSGLVWGSTHLQCGLLVKKLIQRSEHGVRRALVGSKLGKPRLEEACEAQELIERAHFNP